MSTTLMTSYLHTCVVIEKVLTPNTQKKWKKTLYNKDYTEAVLIILEQC